MSLLEQLLCNPSISSEVVYTKLCLKIKRAVNTTVFSVVFSTTRFNTQEHLQFKTLKYIKGLYTVYSCSVVINEMLIITIFEIRVAVSGVLVKILIKKVVIKYS